jgi:hypothetical protein
MITKEDLQDSGKLLTFDDVRERVATISDYNLQDTVVDMTATHVTPSLDFAIPGVGILEMTQWSKSQISSMLGVKWDKWFKDIDHEDAQDELQRRFKNQNLECLVRGRRHLEPKAQNQGTLRAFLSPSYHTIDDRQILDALAASKFGPHLEEIQFVEWHRLRHMFTDKSTHLTGLMGDPVEVFDGDVYYHGLHIRNSEVGYSSITVDDFWFRIICLNGMMTMVGNRSLYKQRHIHVEQDKLEESFDTLWAQIQDRQEQVEDALEDAAEEKMRDPLLRMREFLRRKSVPKYLIDTATTHYETDPIPTRYGVVQAITAAAKGLEDPDSRMDLEKIGGQFLLAA